VKAIDAVEQDVKSPNDRGCGDVEKIDLERTVDCKKEWEGYF
jgi:hypothetical protein